jgi:hypothetical protein
LLLPGGYLQAIDNLQNTYILAKEYWMTGAYYKLKNQAAAAPSMKQVISLSIFQVKSFKMNTCESYLP